MGSRLCAPRKKRETRDTLRQFDHFSTRAEVSPKITVREHSVARIAVLARDVHCRPVKSARGSHLHTSLVITLLKSLDACHLIGGLRW